VADWDGALYEQVNALQRWVADRALAALTFRGDERVLDVGCGDGGITARLAEQLPSGSIVGIDTSPRMVAAAHERHPDLVVELGNVLTMAFDAQFDVVTSFNALHWVPDLASAFGRIHAALRAGGWAHLQFVCGTERPSLESTAMRVCDEPRWAESFAGFTAPFVHPEPAYVAAIAERSGFAVQSQTVDDLRWEFRTGADFRRWVGVGFGDWTARLPGRADEFVADVVARYGEVTGSDRALWFTQLRLQIAPRARAVG
jgi:trans-aconitate 2-methyltransferase